MAQVVRKMKQISWESEAKFGGMMSGRKSEITPLKHNTHAQGNPLVIQIFIF